MKSLYESINDSFKRFSESLEDDLSWKKQMEDDTFFNAAFEADAEKQFMEILRHAKYMTNNPKEARHQALESARAFYEKNKEKPGFENAYLKFLEILNKWYYQNKK